MYKVKKAGRNPYGFYTKELSQDALLSLKISSDALHGLQQGEFYLAYQPQIDMKTRDIIGAEALIRWRHKELGFISPSQFIPVLEDTGFIQTLGIWAIEQACWHYLSLLYQGVVFPSISVIGNNDWALEDTDGKVKNIERRGI